MLAASSTANCSGRSTGYRLRSLALRGNLQRSIAEHRAILRAANARDLERAVHLVSEHIRVPQISGLPVEDLHAEERRVSERSSSASTSTTASR